MRHNELSRVWSDVRKLSQSQSTIRASELEYDSQEAATFDPSHPKYRCCCGHVHAMTGVRIVAGLLSITVLFEMWQMIAGFATTGQGGSTDRIVLKYQMMITGIKFLIGATITASIVVAVLTERAAFLMPYLLLQGAGLAAGMVFFVSFLYISLFGDRSTAVAFLRSQGHPMPKSPNHNYLSYFSWLMTGSFAIIIILQIWLMGIVIACWRYLRDKRAWGADVREYSPYLILRPLTKNCSSFKLRDQIRFSQSAEAIDGQPKKKKCSGRSISVSLDRV